MTGFERYKTLSRQDPGFTAFLDGTFSDSHRALPVRSMNVDTAREEVTFEIVPVGEIRRPASARLAWTLMRPQSLNFSLGPMLVSLLYGWGRQAQFRADLVVSALIAVVLFHVGVNVLDDYFDHRKGRDRLNPRGGSRAIQNGWVRAITLLHAGLGLVCLSILVGLPVVLASPSLILLTALFALAGGLGLVSQRIRLKYRGLGEVITFLLAGPLLTSGFVWATSGSAGREYAVLGCAFGFTSVTYYHLKNIENIMLDSQAGARTLAARLGFDAAKASVWILVALSALSIMTLGWISGSALSFAVAVVAHAFVTVPVARGLGRAASPLSSDLKELRAQGLRAHCATSAALALCIVAEAVRTSILGL